MPISTLSLQLTGKKHCKVFAAGVYREPLRSLVLAKASSDILASRQLAHLILTRIPHTQLACDYFIPIPLHWSRYAFRGFNQATVIARVLSQKRVIPVLSILRRCRRTVFQSMLSPKQRLENVRNAFEIKGMYRKKVKEILQDKHLILVDDLCTTGATLQQAAKILMRYKPASVIALVAARAI
jgi:ComF family protein